MHIQNSTLKNIYRRLYRHFGPQHWWPGETQLEVIVGAILTQNTNWRNVEKAIVNLQNQRLLTVEALRKVSFAVLASCIRPAGYFNVKARRLKSFIDFLFKEYGGSLTKMGHEPLADLRIKLLNVHGIGPETADSILLYAFNKPSFVVDAYTKRFLYRHNFIQRTEDYHAVRDIFMGTLAHDPVLFNEYHALIVRLAKDFCRTKPHCEGCPLQDFHYSLGARCDSCYRALPIVKETARLKRVPRQCPDCH